MTTATLERAAAQLNKGIGFRAGATTHPILKGKDVEDIVAGQYTASELLKHLGGDFQVAKRPLLVETSTGLAKSGMFAIVEGEDRIHGGAVSERYPIYQFTEMADHVDEIIASVSERLGVNGELEALFLLRGGGLALFVVDFDMRYLVGDDDVILQKLIMSTGHGGESAVRSMIQGMRLFCANQIPSLTSHYSRSKGGILYEQHTTAGLQRVDNVAALATLAVESAKGDKEIAEILATIPQGLKDLERYLREGPGKFTATTTRGTAALEGKVERVLTRFASEPQNAWGCFNSIGYYEETVGDADGLRQVRTLNRAVEGNHTPRAMRYLDFVLPDSVKAQYRQN